MNRTIQSVHGIASTFHGRRPWILRGEHAGIADEDGLSEDVDVIPGRELSGVTRILASREAGLEEAMSARKPSLPAVVCALRNFRQSNRDIKSPK